MGECNEGLPAFVDYIHRKRLAHAKEIILKVLVRLNPTKSALVEYVPLFITRLVLQFQKLVYWSNTFLARPERSFVIISFELISELDLVIVAVTIIYWFFELTYI